MGILGLIIIGGIAGWLASLVMKTNASMGILANIVVGIVGAFLGGFLFGLVGGSGINGFNVYSLFVAFVGAVVLLGIVRMFTRSRAV